MTMDSVHERGLVLLGCGKMGGAMLSGWISGGLPASSVTVIDPYPSDLLTDLQERGLRLNESLPKNPAVCLLAVKPQMMGDALPQVGDVANGDTLFLSVAAGTSIQWFEDALGDKTAIVRAMPNTPAAIKRGITAIVGNAAATEAHLALAEALLGAVGETVRLSDEHLIDGVTGVSGSGPAYVFHMIETMAAAGVAEGLDEDMAMKLAIATVAGAGALALESDETPSQLRVNVTSPHGTTAAALEVLMDEDHGFPSLLRRAVHASAQRSRDLAG